MPLQAALTNSISFKCLLYALCKECNVKISSNSGLLISPGVVLQGNMKGVVDGCAQVGLLDLGSANVLADRPDVEAPREDSSLAAACIFDALPNHLTLPTFALNAPQ